MKLLLVWLILLALPVMAEPLYYLTMRQYCTNGLQGVEIVDQEYATAEACTNAMLAFAADPDWFGDSGEGELAWDATIHQHDHFNPTPCKTWTCGSHRSKQTPPANIVCLIEELEQDPDHPTRYMPCQLRIDAVREALARQKAKKIKTKDGKEKKWKLQ